MVGNRDCYQKSSRSDAVFGVHQLTWVPLRLDLLRSDYTLAVARAEASPLDVSKGSSAESRWQSSFRDRTGFVIFQTPHPHRVEAQGNRVCIPMIYWRAEDNLGNSTVVANMVRPIRKVSIAS